MYLNNLKRFLLNQKALKKKAAAQSAHSLCVRLELIPSQEVMHTEENPKVLVKLTTPEGLHTTRAWIRWGKN